MEERKKCSTHKPFFLKGAFLYLAVLLVFGIVVPSQFAHALSLFSIGNIVGGAILSMVAYLLQVFVAIAAFFAAIAGSFMEWVLRGIPLLYTKCDAAGCFLDVAWKLARDLANTWLAIAIVIIAVSTIIGKESYGMRKALIPLIVAALFVNFSRVLVGIVVDLSNIIMDVFVQALPNFSAITSTLGKSGVSWTLGSLDTQVALGNVVQMVVMTIFFLGMAFILALYGIIFAVRYVALWFLTILSPLAFVAYIFPSTKKFFDQWMKQLIQWSIVGIPVLFFLWIALLAASQLSGIGPAANVGASSAEKFFTNIIPPVFSLFLLYVAFAFGMQTSAMGTGMIINTGKKWAGKVQGAARNAALAPARWARTKAEQGLSGAAEKGLQGIAGSRLSRIPLVGGGVRGATVLGGQKLQELKQKRLADAQKRAAGMSEAMRLKQIQSETDPDSLKALIETQHKEDPESIRKLMNDGKLSPERMRALVKSLSLRNLEKDIINYFPEFASASRNRTALDRTRDQDLLDLIRAGTLTADEGMVAKRVKDRTKEKAKLIDSGSLANKAVMLGLDLNKNVDPFEDLATTDQRMRNIISGYIAKNNGDAAKAMEEIAMKFKRKNIKYASSLFNRLEFIKALVEKNANKLIPDFLEEIGEYLGEEPQNKIFETAHAFGSGDPILNKTIHDDTFVKRFYDNTRMKSLMRKDLIDAHDREGRGGAGGGGGGGGTIITPPPRGHIRGTWTPGAPPSGGTPTPPSAPPTETGEGTTPSTPPAERSQSGYYKGFEKFLPQSFQHFTQNLSEENLKTWYTASPAQKAFLLTNQQWKRPMDSDEFAKTYNSVPDEVKNAIGSMETANSIQKIARNEGFFSPKDISHLAETTGDVMLGKLPIDSFTNTIQGELFIGYAKARTIAERIANEVFSPIAVGLSQVQANIK
ncbi:MAG: hypothetical protein HYS15_00075 [Candidatus Spechtbacteria bacterium]|nr:hypothetical protein [Candidatus Spechtbacteria bacterium]